MSPGAGAAEARPYLGFVDWLKCTGICLIVLGHVAGGPFVRLMPPISFKQLGVAMFIFAMACLLARERRGTAAVVLGRLFEVYVFGVLAAVLQSIVMLGLAGTINASNYLPFLLGVNVLVDYFPANPTTWFIGTYLHLLLVWALVRQVRIGWQAISVALAVEVVVRAAVLAKVGNFVAYMLVPNWTSVFLLGLLVGRDAPGPDAAAGSARARFLSAGAALAFVAGLGQWTRSLVAAGGFPFMWIGSTGAAGALLTSVFVSGWYVAVTTLAYASFAGLPVPRPVRFVARNTLVIFIGHMPVVYSMRAMLDGRVSSEPVQWMSIALVCLVGLAWLSELLHRMLPLRRMRQRLLALAGVGAARAAVAGA